MENYLQRFERMARIISLNWILINLDAKQKADIFSSQSKQ
jgi:hypothetical protein